MNVEDIVGNYFIKGRNQEEGEVWTYEGMLSLSVDENGRVVALWKIGEHEQRGKGFFKNDILVLNFSYNGDDKVYKGVAVYRCLNENTLDGFWSEKYGDPRYLGAEYCEKIDSRFLWN